MQLKRIAEILTAGALATGLAGAGTVPALASSTKHPKAPLLKALTYTPLTTDGSDGFLQAHFTATIELYQNAPSIFFKVDSVGSHNIEVEEGPEPSYRAGVHKVSFTGGALPGGTFRITLFAYQRPSANRGSSALLRSPDPATLVVQEAPEGGAGTGLVTKI